MLSDCDIAQEILKGELVIDPVRDSMIQPSSVDLHLGDQLLFPRTEYSLSGVKEFALIPGVFALGSTKERVKIPRYLAAQLNGKSSLGRLGLMVHVTAGFIDPGFEGEITLELYNLSQELVTLRPGMPIAQLSFWRLNTPANRVYGDPVLGSKYQGQCGPTPSRITKEVS